MRLFKKDLFIYFREGERESTSQGRGRERAPDVGRDLRILRS